MPSIATKVVSKNSKPLIPKSESEVYFIRADGFALTPVGRSFDLSEAHILKSIRKDKK